MRLSNEHTIFNLLDAIARPAAGASCGAAVCVGCYFTGGHMIIEQNGRRYRVSIKLDHDMRAVNNRFADAMACGV